MDRLSRLRRDQSVVEIVKLDLENSTIYTGSMTNMSEPKKAPSSHVSVTDFENDNALLQELVIDEIERNHPGYARSKSIEEEEEEIGNWMLYEFDEQTAEATTASEEFRRLQVLRSYCALDIQEESIDHLTRTAAMTFGVTGAWVCLVDFRRIVYLSKHGMDDLHILPRVDRYAFAHAIQYRADRAYVVPDMSKNRLYEKLELVCQPPFMKFYASAVSLGAAKSFLLFDCRLLSTSHNILCGTTASYLSRRIQNWNLWFNRRNS